MNTHEFGLGRRDFLRISSMTGLGLGFILQRCLAGAVLPDSDTAPAKTVIADGGEIIVGLDIGSSKVCAAVGERLPDGTIKILGVGAAPSFGIRNREVVDPDAVTKCVRAALVDAEQKADVMIGSVRLAVLPWDTERLMQ